MWLDNGNPAHDTKVGPKAGGGVTGVLAATPECSGPHRNKAPNKAAVQHNKGVCVCELGTCHRLWKLEGGTVACACVPKKRPGAPDE